MLEPYYKLSDVPCEWVRPFPRCSLWERHGGVAKSFCKNIDLMLRGGQYFTAGTQRTQVPADLVMIAQQARLAREKLPCSSLGGSTLDFTKAFGQQTAAPETAHRHTVAILNRHRA